jgi:hypothetical protein
MIFFGNEDNLKEFREHFSAHDKKTLDSYYRVAKKKESLMVVRRSPFEKKSMQIMIIPYKLAKEGSDLRKGLKGYGFRTGWIKTLNVDTKKLFVFGDKVDKNETPEFKQPMKIGKKRKPFEQREA